MVISKFKNSIMTLMFSFMFKLLWVYFTKRPSKFYTMIYSAKSLLKRFVEWKYLALILSEEISDGICSS